MLNNFIKENGDLFSTVTNLTFAKKVLCVFCTDWKSHVLIPRPTTKVSQPWINFHMFF